MDIDLVKKKLLKIHSTGIFAKFNANEINEIYKELKQVILNEESIEVTELYDLYELHVYLSLITNHDTEAKSYIDRLVDQFGDVDSERVNLLKSLYLEANGNKKGAVEILSANTNELNLTRRLTTFSRTEKDNTDYIKNLNLFLDLQPSDLVTWAELAEQYEILGHYDKAIFCLKEILIQEPLAYSIHYKVGLLNYYLFIQNYQNVKNDTLKKDKLIELTQYLLNARDNYLRTVEICKDHQKSWLGIYIICNLKFNDKLKISGKEIEAYKTGIEKLKSLAKQKVETVVQVNDIKIEY